MDHDDKDDPRCALEDRDTMRLIPIHYEDTDVDDIDDIDDVDFADTDVEAPTSPLLALGGRPAGV